LSAIHWEAPWYSAWRESGEAIGSAAGLRERGGFVAASGQPAGEAYESFIHRTGTIPTRDNLHDFFNGLVWLHFPRSKREFNRLQAAEIARDGIGARRGPVRDAITVFDENGALLHAPQPLWEALLAREWRRVFADLRPLWREAQLTIFGHALLEQLASPRKGLTAHVWCADAPRRAAELDDWLADRITREALAAKPFTPLPVLGVPGWWAGNEADSFYDDPLVFRPRRGLKNGMEAAPAAPGHLDGPSENQ
jgi:hypothetical protein